MAGTAEAEPWRVLIDMILREVASDAELTPRLAAVRAGQLVARPLADLSQEGEYAAVTSALLSRTSLSVRLLGHLSESAIRGFLARLRWELDAVRPWPEPFFHTLAADRWESAAQGRVVGRISENGVPTRVWRFEVEGRLRTVFRPVRGRDLLGLRLRDGLEVALVSRDTDILVLTADRLLSPVEAAATIADRTGLDVAPA
jgi:hypothetical protein